MKICGKRVFIILLLILLTGVIVGLPSGNIALSNGEKGKLIIDNFKVVGGRYNFSDVQKAASELLDVSLNKDPTTDEVLNHLKQLNDGDAWIYFGHTGYDEKQGKVVGLKPFEKKGGAITSEQIKDNLENPPSLVFIGGCQGLELSETFLEAGVKVFISFDKPLSASAGAAALINFWLAFLSGEKTVQEAIDEANRYLPGPESPLNRKGAKLKALALSSLGEDFIKKAKLKDILKVQKKP
jgi:hypothetical protein